MFFLPAIADYLLAAPRRPKRRGGRREGEAARVGAGAGAAAVSSSATEDEPDEDDPDDDDDDDAFEEDTDDVDEDDVVVTPPTPARRLKLGAKGGARARATSVDLAVEMASFEQRKAFTFMALRRVINTAVASRVLIFVVGNVSVALVGAYDSSSQIVVGDAWFPFQCAVNWDGAWFTRIAERGYTYESEHAFFPLMPLLVRLFGSTLARPLAPLFENEAAFLAWCGTFIANMFFPSAAAILYILSEKALNDPASALRAALLFCFNPASIFFSAAYSESLFAFLAFSGMALLAPPLYHHVGATSTAPSFRNRLAASALFGLATAARSNGTILSIHSLWAAAHALAADTDPSLAKRLVRATLQLAAVTLVHAAFLVSVLGLGWYRFCFAGAGFPTHKWCGALVPNIYTHVQSAYWGLGPFEFWQPQQAPNFVLAAPIVFFSLRTVRKFWRTQPPHVAQLFLSVLIAVVSMHVQVSTRFICASCPAVFWFASRATAGGGGKGYFTLVFFALYTVLGTALFCNFLPFT